jgi:hypothetical protein
MTAEIAILNKEAVAMAADSAVTVTTTYGKKILPSANKIFSLSKCHPVGIMVYGSGSLMGTPWETIIKMYRQELGHKEFGKLGDYADSFMSFIKKENKFFPEREQINYITYVIDLYYRNIREEIRKVAERAIKNNPKEKISDVEAKQIFDKIVKTHLRHWKEAKPIVEKYEEKFESFKAKFSTTINDIQQDLFKNLTPSQSNDLTDIAIMFFLKYSKQIHGPNVSGVVIAGFGKDEIYPSLRSFDIDGVANDILKYMENDHDTAEPDGLSTIIPFAQKEMVYSFMEGINPLLEEQIYDFISEIFREYPKILLKEIEKDEEKRSQLEKGLLDSGAKIKNKIVASLAEFRNKHFVGPILSVVAFLSKIELAEMAEALVNLSVFKKRMSLEDETVGGPVDVVVISKGDGLIWIKRKHYFNPELNRHFFANYYNFDKNKCDNECEIKED